MLEDHPPDGLERLPPSSGSADTYSRDGSGVAAHDAILARPSRAGSAPAGILRDVRILLAALLAVPLAGAATYPGVKPRPAFATPGQAAYCAVETAGSRTRGELRCWTPRNGLWLAITWNGTRAQKGATTTFPQIAHGLTKLQGYRPSAPGARLRAPLAAPVR